MQPIVCEQIDTQAKKLLEVIFEEITDRQDLRDYEKRMNFLITTSQVAAQLIILSNKILVEDELRGNNERQD